MRKLSIIIILSFVFTATINFIVWAHHFFVTGLNPFLGAIFLLASIILSVPISIFLFRKLSAFLKDKISLTPDALFLMGAFSFLISDLILGIFYGHTTLDFQAHDTYYVIANAHAMIGAALIFGMFSAVYYLFLIIFKRKMNEPMGYIHF